MFNLDEITDGDDQCMVIMHLMQPGQIDIGFKLSDGIVGLLKRGAVSFKFGDLRTTGYMLWINRADNTAMIICSPHLLSHNDWSVGDRLAWSFEPTTDTITFMKFA